jgi:hypothetical protein
MLRVDEGATASFVIADDRRGGQQNRGAR